MKRVALGTAVLLVACSLALAQSDQDRQKLGGTPAQERITREVRHELLLLPRYSVFDWLQYKVDGSTVTLLGYVTNPTKKQDAQNAVKHIEGVENIVNDIEVLPTSFSDDRIRQAEYRAIYGFPSFRKYDYGPVPPIHIIVKNGHVTLEGVVDNQADKDTANIRARGVPGVFSVTNNLQVQQS